MQFVKLIKQINAISVMSYRKKITQNKVNAST